MDQGSNDAWLLAVWIEHWKSRYVHSVQLLVPFLIFLRGGPWRSIGLPGSIFKLFLNQVHFVKLVDELTTFGWNNYKHLDSVISRIKVVWDKEPRVNASRLLIIPFIIISYTFARVRRLRVQGRLTFFVYCKYTSM
jgi:hypothetical protein